jgi:surface protein
MIKKKQLLELVGHMFLLFSLFSVSGMTAQQTYTLDWGFNINGENASLTIETGDTVQWIWVDGGGHSVTSTPSSQESFDSGILQGAGSIYSYTFTQEGVNEYVCTPHSATMFGTITVASSLNDFFLAPNGVTCMCPNAAVGDSGDPGDGIVYTKRVRSQINSQNAATTCTSGITDMSALFYDNSNFNEDISSWDVSSVTNMSLMFFENSSFNQSIGLWNVGLVTDMSYLFTGTPFNNPIGDWNVGSVTNMREMFNGSVNFNQAINNWDVSSVTDMGLMFKLSPFNQAIGNWDVSNVTTMAGMFAETSFNQDISSWDVSNVIEMVAMFAEASFNQDISSWDVSNVINMSFMFLLTSNFNQPLEDWNVSNVTSMEAMFEAAENFNQDISNWQFNDDVSLFSFINDSGLDINNYDALLATFSNQNLVNKTLVAQGLTYCNVSAREDLINNKSWTINGDSYSPPMITAPSDLNIDPDPSSCVAANIDLGTPTITGGCGIQTIGNDAPNEFPIGTTQVLWTLVDGSGFENTDTQTVTVIFNDPIITAPNNLNIDPDPSSCVAANIDLGAPTVTGGCGIQTISNDAPNEFPIGTTQVLWTLVDGSGIENTDTQTVTVIFNDPIITAPNNLNIDPDPSSCVAANIDLGAPTVIGGCGIQTISNDAPNEFAIGTTQVLWTLVDGSGIETTDTQTVTVTLQVDVADLCYVSSDQTQITNNRIFITNDPANSGLNVAYYDVLRESQSGAYESIGFITPPEVSFLDIESNNASQAYRYKIRTTDVCGASYPESSFHKTILLQSGIASDNSINLSWTPYLGLDFTTYNIFKNTNGTGYALLTSLSFNNTTFNDTSANVVDNFYEYYISIEVASCGSDPLLPFNLRSNLELVNPNLSITNTNWLNQEIQIYPNPTSDYINISFPNQIEITTVSIYNALGQLVFDTNKFENIYISELSAGLYYLSIDTNKGVVKKTMIRE